MQTEHLPLKTKWPARPNPKIMSSSASCLGRILLLPFSIWLRAHTIASLWFWFVASQFNIVALTKPQAYGIGILITYLAMHAEYRETPENDDYRQKAFIHGVMMSFFVPALVLLSGWVTYTYFIGK